MIGSVKLNAQTTISLDEAINLAVQNNRNLKNEKLRSDFAKALIKTSTADIPQTSVSAEYGQINSAYKDMKFGVSQSIAFPTVYKKQKNLYTEEWKKSQLNVSLKEFELKKLVSQTYFQLVYWKEKEKLLNEALQLYSNFLEKASLRLKAGESNVLEKATASNQKSAIDIQLKQIQQEVKTLQLQLQWLLNSEVEYLPLETSKTNILNPEISSHPLLKMLEQQKTVAEKQTEVEKSRLLPDLQLAYNLNSFKGTGADDKIYNATPQFHSVMLGVGIPIFSGGQKARIEASKMAENIAENDRINTEFSLNIKATQLRQIYQTNLEIVNRYEVSELKNAEIITETAQKQFSNGEINYLEFVMLINQTLALKSNYTDALLKLNESAIELQYLTLNQ